MPAPGYAAAAARTAPPVLLVLGALVLLGACATPPSQTYRSTYQTSETGTMESTSWTNLAEIGIQENLGADLEYRISERLIHTDQENLDAGTTFSSERILHQPSFDLLMAFGPLRWLQGFEQQVNRTQLEGSPDNELTRTDLLQRVEWTPEGLPALRAWIDYRDEEDDQFVDQATTEYVLELEQEVGRFDYQYAFQNEDIDRQATGSESRRNQHTFRGGYRDQFLDGRLDTSVNVFFDERRDRTSFPTGPPPLTEVFPVQGLSVLDTTPQIATLAINPLLIDSDLNTSAGVNIGGFASGGELSWNIGTELPPGAAIDFVRLTTLDEVDSFLVGQFSFSVWASDDNTFWDLVTSSATYTYNASQQYFELTIPAVTQRYLKVVNTASPAAAPAVLITELQTFDSSISGGPGANVVHTQDSIQSLSGNATWRVAENVTLTYDLLASSTSNEVAGSTNRDESRMDHGLTAFWEPHEIVDVTLRTQLQSKEDTIQGDEDFLYLNGHVITRPLETLDLTLNYTRTQRDRDNLDALDTSVAQVGASAQLLDTLRTDLVFELNTQEDFENQREIDRTVIAATIAAELTRRLDMTLGLRNEDATVSGAGAAGIPDPNEERYEVVLVYHASENLTADAQIEWVDNFAGAGLDQRYRLDWIPFRDGSLDIQLGLDRTENRSTGAERIDRYQVLSRWAVNPRTFFEVNFASQVPEISQRTDLLLMSFNATI